MKKNELVFLLSGGLSLAVGIVLLPLAILGGFFYFEQFSPEWSQRVAWYSNYDHGYVSRGLLGIVFRFFHGPPTPELINQIVPNWEAIVIFTEITLFWVLLVTPIFLRKFTPPTKWLLLAFAAVLLLAPIWRDASLHVGHCDEWLLLFAIFALIAIITKRPIIYLLCILPSFLIHPAALFYAVLLSGIILHAILRTPGYAAQWRVWLAAIVIPFLLSLLLYSLQSPEAVLAVLEPLLENHPYGHEWARGTRLNYTEPHSTIRTNLSTTRELWWLSVMTGIVVFGLPSLVFALLFASSMVKWMRYEDSRIPYSHPFPPAVAKFLSRYDAHIILAGGAFAWSPILYFAFDWSRFFHWSWWNLGLLVAYFLWTSGGDTPAPAQPPPPQHPPMRKRVTALSFVWAWTFLGAPLNDAYPVTPWLFQCNRWCVFPLTVNPLGTWYSHGINYALLSALNPTVRGDGEDIWNLTWSFRGLVSHQDGQLLVPSDFRGTLLRHRRTLPADRVFSLTLRHESDGIPPVGLWIKVGNTPLPEFLPLQPIKQSAEQTVWIFFTPRMSTYNFAGIYDMYLYSEGGKAFTISEFILGFED